MVQAQSIQNFALKFPITALYTVSGWLVAEVPVALSLLPATFTFDGQVISTSSIGAGLAFVASGAMWIHSELSHYINTPSSVSVQAAQTSVSRQAQSSSSAPADSQTFTAPPTPAHNVTAYLDQNGNLVMVANQIVNDTYVLELYMVNGGSVNIAKAATANGNFTVTIPSSNTVLSTMMEQARSAGDAFLWVNAINSQGVVAYRCQVDV